VIGLSIAVAILLVAAVFFGVRAEKERARRVAAEENLEKAHRRMIEGRRKMVIEWGRIVSDRKVRDQMIEVKTDEEAKSLSADLYMRTHRLQDDGSNTAPGA
jgi:tRNA A37 threonylcarbamoyladenosine biosynthesis protein TsaE